MPQRIGKSYRGQVFVPIRTVESVEDDERLRARYDSPDAIPIQTWFKIRGHNDPVKQAGMLAFTRVRRAEPGEWDRIFATY